MYNFKVALFDVDGVLVIPPKLFSDVYCDRYGVDLEKLLPFYSSKEFENSSIGKLDLKEAIRIHNDKWQWDGDPDDLISEWFQAENYPNDELIKKVRELRAKGIKVYVATQQEKYRATFLRDTVFKNVFDGFFASCDLGLHKDTGEFWNKVVTQLQKDILGLNPREIIYFDDKQKLVDVASTTGINAHLYTDYDSAAKLLV